MCVFVVVKEQLACLTGFVLSISVSVLWCGCVALPLLPLILPVLQSDLWPLLRAVTSSQPCSPVANRVGCDQRDNLGLELWSAYGGGVEVSGEVYG